LLWLLGTVVVLILASILPAFSEEMAGVVIVGVVPLSTILLSIFTRARWFLSGPSAIVIHLAAMLSGFAGDLNIDGVGVAILMAVAVVNAGLCSLASFLRGRWAARREV
jgi:hypothetical protein